MLNGKQKSYLKGLANPLKALFQVGKEGLSSNLVSTLKDSLKAHELVKLNLLKTCPDPINEVAFDLAAKTNSEIVQIIGRTMILYRRSDDGKIQLPR